MKKLSLIVITALLIFGLNKHTFAQDVEMMILGRGIDLISGEPRNDCIEGNFDEIKSEARIAEFQLLRIEDTEKLAEELNVSASASLFNSKGKASFMKRFELNQYSLYVLVKATVQFSPQTINSPRIKDDFVKIFSNDPEQFRTMCGDEFVHYVTKGGEYYGLITITTKDETEKRQLGAEIEGSLGMFSAQGEFRRKLESLSQRFSLKTYQYFKGGTSSFSVDPEVMINNAVEFSDRINLRNAYPYDIESRGYKVVVFSPGKSPIDVTNQSDVISQMSDKRYAYLRQLANINYILEHQDEFINPLIENLSTYRNTVNENLNKIHEAASKCFKDYQDCQLPSLTDITVSLPERKEKLEPPINLCYKEKADPICGVKSYNRKRDPKCGVERYKEGSGAVCGIKEYNLGRSPECGVELYNLKQDPLCGVKETKTQPIPCPPGWSKICWTEYPDPELGEPGEPGGPGGGHIFHPITKCKCQQTIYDECRRPEFGVERYNECRHVTHGASYNTCRSEQFGVELYYECEDMTFGVKEYNTCRNPAFGTEPCEQSK